MEAARPVEDGVDVIVGDARVGEICEADVSARLEELPADLLVELHLSGYDGQGPQRRRWSHLGVALVKAVEIDDGQKAVGGGVFNHGVCLEPCRSRWCSYTGPNSIPAGGL